MRTETCPDCGYQWSQLGTPIHRGDCPRLDPLYDFRNEPPDVVLERLRKPGKGKSGASVRRTR